LKDRGVALRIVTVPSWSSSQVVRSYIAWMTIVNLMRPAPPVHFSRRTDCPVRAPAASHSTRQNYSTSPASSGRSVRFKCAVASSRTSGIFRLAWLGRACD
jgi:hypothetical protein